ncbi:mitochondrial amidoxime-reducing component 1 isoform X7 [Bombus impatiens]|uniref:Mitochondrial amidoxime-reducing component 1 isoform X7 n=1 Tax=Bombus impatiens TaxID=132113 RepID=A0A6P3UQ68_BOMIM|nr:mitochondrial amidoxime-reducing component 1 isoform X7 [Bombus impatiens]
MQEHPYWRSTIAITCGFVVILAAAVWTIRKTSHEKRKRSRTNDSKEPDKVNANVNSESNINNKNEVTREEDVNVEENEETYDKQSPNDKEYPNDEERPKDEERPNDEECPKDDTIAELPDPKWEKVGQIQELYMYPLKSGRGKNVRECDFTEYGMKLDNAGKFALRDRMFLVYNEETGRFQTGRQYPTLILVSLSVVDENKVKLEAVGMPSVIFEVPKNLMDASEAVQCKMWWGEPVNCIDCGTEPAEWLSRFLTGTTSGLRLGYTRMDRRDVFVDPWKKFTQVYRTLRSEDTGLFSDLASYMLMTTSSVEQLNEKLETPVSTLQFRPNILVSTQQPFEEDEWEWIKIGERVVIRNVKPCSRCKLVGVNPENGVMDKEEPLKTLKSFREPTDPERISLEGKAPVMGIYCGLYVTGRVQIGDEVFIHRSNDSSVELNHREAENPR